MGTLTGRRWPALWLVIALSSSALAQTFSILPIARPGDLVLDGEQFITVYNVSINDAGNVAFPGNRIQGSRGIIPLR